MEKKYYTGEQILEALSEVGVGAGDISEVMSCLGRMPSAKPTRCQHCKYFTIVKNQIVEEVKSAEPIIRCKDCKWWGRVDKRRFYRGSDCLRNHLCSIVPDRDFCSRAERREDD